MTVRELHGWSPSTVTLDNKGRVLSVSVTEPRFTPTEVELLLGSRRVESEPRGPHGFTIAEATDPETRGRWYVEPPTVDFAEEVLNRERDKYAKAWPDVDMGSRLFSVKLRPKTS